MNNKLENVLSLQNISKSFKQGDNKIDVLNSININIEKSQMVALVGESGCGKSTMLQIAGLLDKADSGKVIIDDVDCSAISDQESTMIRSQKIGFVYQSHNLLREFSAIENVMIPQIIAGVHKKDAREKSADLLSKMGLSDRINHRPSDLSGGEQQRTAIARALINDPAILLADEPTGNLDPQTAQHVLDILIEYINDCNLSMFIVTHNHQLAEQTDRILSFKENAIVEGFAKGDNS